MRGLRAAVLGVGLAVAYATVTPAQTDSRVALPQTPLLTLDEEMFFTGSRFGKALIAAQDADSQALMAENRKIEAALEAEERTLTEQRNSMSREAFAPLAAAFDIKAEELRTAQETKSRALTRRFDEQRQRFFETASPVLGQLMRERGGVAIVSKRAVIASFENIDITAAAIARLDAVLGDGNLAPATVTPPEPAPAEPAPVAPATP